MEQNLIVYFCRSTTSDKISNIMPPPCFIDAVDTHCCTSLDLLNKKRQQFETKTSNLDSFLHKVCVAPDFQSSSSAIWPMSAFSPIPPFLKNGFLPATRRIFQVLCQIWIFFCLFLKDMTFNYYLTALDIFLCLLPFLLSSTC